MNTAFAHLPLPFAPFPVARIAGSFGYRFEGDQVELNAGVEALNGFAGDLSLQLWACDASGQPERAVKVGECAADVFHGAHGWSPALPPAGREARSMVMALAANGQIQDLAWLPVAEQFAQPRLAGCSGYRLDGAEVEISVETIENPRAADNLSGDLRVELWALDAPYAGGAFTGLPVAQAGVGRLSGEQRLTDLNWRVPAELPAQGEWTLTLMLREWTANGYATRDYLNFVTPYVAAQAAPRAEAPVAAVTLPMQAEPAPAPAKPTKAAKRAPRASAAAPKTKATPGKADTPANAVVSINTASAAELAAVKGLSRPVAEAIVAGRPYASVDELVRVKGLGAKTLAKLRTALKK